MSISSLPDRFEKDLVCIMLSFFVVLSFTPVSRARDSDNAIHIITTAVLVAGKAQTWNNGNGGIVLIRTGQDNIDIGDGSDGALGNG